MQTYDTRALIHYSIEILCSDRSSKDRQIKSLEELQACKIFGVIPVTYHMMFCIVI